MVKKTISLLLVFTMIFTIAIPSNAYATDKDYAGHWAEEIIQLWINNGNMTGYPDGSFKPEGYVTRAEFVTMVNNLFDYSETSAINFADVNSNDWYYQEVQKAFKAGYIAGLSQTQFAPNDNLTREQAAVIVSRIAKLEGDFAAADIFTDKNKISNWAIDLVGATAKAKIFKGYNDSSFRPQNPITRAEAVVTLDRMGSNLKDLTIDKAGTVLENKTVRNLHITKAVGDGNVTLKNVTVTGEMLVEGGGQNSIIIENSTINQLTANKKDGKVRILITGDTAVTETSILSGVTLEQEGLTGTGFEDVTIDENANQSQTITVKANLGTLSVNAKIKVNVVTGEIESIIIEKTAEGASINLSEDAMVLLVTIDVKVSFTGTGTIISAKINVNEVSFEQEPDDINLAPGINGPKITPPSSRDGVRRGSPAEPSTVAVTGVTLSTTSTSIKVGGTVVLTATVNPSNATNKTVNWISSDEEVATVNNGLVAGVSTGTAIITVKTVDGDFRDICTVNVETNTEESPKTVAAVTNIRYAIVRGDVEVLFDKPIDTTGITEFEVQFSSDNGSKWENYYCVNLDNSSDVPMGDAVRKINETTTYNKVKVVSCVDSSTNYTENSAEAQIEFTFKVEGEALLFTVVKDKDNHYILTLPEAAQLGDLYSVQVTKANSGPDYYPLGFVIDSKEISDSKITIQDNDIVKGSGFTVRKITSVTITGFKVTPEQSTPVVAPQTVNVSAISINEAYQELEVGTTLQLIATVAPENATNKKVTWSTSDDNIATVSDEGLVTGVAKGEVTIIVTTEDGNKTDDIVVTVVGEPFEAGFSFNSIVQNVGYSEKDLIWINFYPELLLASSDGDLTEIDFNDVTVTVGDVEYPGREYTDHEPEVEYFNVKVHYTGTDHVGIIKIKGSSSFEESIQITVTGKNRLSGTATINFVIPVSAITVTGEGNVEEVENGQTLQMIADVQPNNASNKAVTWSVEAGTGTATINQDGLLTATGVGEVTVKATAQDGSEVVGEKVIIIVPEAAPVEDFIKLTGTNYDNLKEKLQFAVSYQEHADYDKLGIIKVTGTITQAKLEAAGLVVNDQQVDLSVWIKAPEGAETLTGGGYTNATTWDNTDGAGYWSTLNPLFAVNGDKFELVDVYKDTQWAGQYVGKSSFDVQWFDNENEIIVHQGILLDASEVEITEDPGPSDQDVVDGEAAKYEDNVTVEKAVTADTVIDLSKDTETVDADMIESIVLAGDDVNDYLEVDGKVVKLKAQVPHDATNNVFTVTVNLKEGEATAEAVVTVTVEKQEDPVEDFIKLSGENYDNLKNKLDFVVSYQDHANYDKLGIIKVTGTITQADLAAAGLVVNDGQVDLSVWIKAPVGAYSLTGGGYENATSWDNTDKGYWSTLNPLFVKNGDKFELTNIFGQEQHKGLYSFDVKWMDAEENVIMYQAITIDARTVKITEEAEEVVEKSDLQAKVTEVEGLQQNDYTEATWGPFATALTEAQAVIDNAEATQEVVNTALTNLESAIEGLVDKAEVDFITLTDTNYDKLKKAGLNFQVTYQDHNDYDKLGVVTVTGEITQSQLEGLNADEVDLSVWVKAPVGAYRLTGGGYTEATTWDNTDEGYWSTLNPLFVKNDGEFEVVKTNGLKIFSFDAQWFDEDGVILHQAITIDARAVSITVEANLTDYSAALAAVVEDDYTVASWEAYQVVVAANVVTVANTQEEVNTATGLITAAQADLVEAVDFIKLSGTNYTSLNDILGFDVSYQDHDGYDKLGVVTVTGEITQSQLEELNADGIDLSVWVKAPVGAESLTGGGYIGATTWDNTGEGYWSTVNPLFVKNGDKLALVDAYGAEEHKGLYSFDVQWMDADGVVIIHQAITIDASAVDIITEADLTAYNAALAAVVQADYTLESWEAYQLVVAANVVTVANTQEDVEAATAAITAAQADLVEAVDFLKLSGTNYEDLKEKLNFEVSYQDHDVYDKLGVVTVTGEITQSQLEELNADEVDLSVWVKAPVGAYRLTGGGYTNATTWDNTGEGYWSTLNPLFVKNDGEFEVVKTEGTQGIFSFDAKWMDNNGDKIMHQAITIDARAVKITEEADLTDYSAALAAVVEDDYTVASWEAYQVVVAANVVTVADTQVDVDAATAAITAAQGDLVEAVDFIKLSGTNYENLKDKLNFQVSYQDHASYDKLGVVKVTGAITQEKLEELNDQNQVDLSVWVKAPVGADRLTGGGYENATTWDNTGEGYWSTLNPLFVKNGDKFELVDTGVAGIFSFDAKWMDAGTNEIMHQAITIDARNVVITDEPADKDALQAAINDANALIEDDYTEATWASFAAALSAAQDVLADEEAVETALENLESAIEGLVEKALVDFIKLVGANYESLNKTELNFTVSYQEHDSYDKLGVVTVTGEITQNQLKELNADGIDLSVWVKAPVGADRLTGGGYENATSWDNTDEGYWSTLTPLFVKNEDKFELVDVFGAEEHKGLYSFDVQWFDEDGVILHQAITIDARTVSITE